MLTRVTAALIVAGLALPSMFAVASQEGVLPIGEFRITSPGLDGSGPVVVTGEQNDKEIVALSVYAFGHTTNLNKSQLAQLKGGHVDGLQLSFEMGYPSVGGRTVYLVFSTGFTSGVVTTQLVSVNEQGSVNIRSPKQNQAS